MDKELSGPIVLTDLGVSMMVRMPEFHYLSRDDIKYLARNDPRVYKKGESLLSPGDGDMKTMVILLAGSCKIEVHTRICGKPAIVCIEKVSAPAVLGEVTSFSSSNVRRSVDVIAAQRSIAISIPSSILLECFSHARVSLPQILWGFARLGLARLKTSQQHLETLLSRYIKVDGVKGPELDEEIQELESVIGLEDMKAGAEVGEGVFDKIGELLNKINHALAFACYLDQTPDYRLEKDIPTELYEKAGVSTLAREALEIPENRGRTIREAVACAMVSLPAGKRPPIQDWRSYLEALITAAEDIMSIIPDMFRYNNRRRVHPGSDKMIEGFLNRVEQEFDRAWNEAITRFGVKPAEESNEDDIKDLSYLGTFFLTRLEGIKFRQTLDFMEPGGQQEYRPKDEQLRDRAAIELYNTLSAHPVMKILIKKLLDTKVIEENSGAEKNDNLVGLLCLAYRHNYPALVDEPNRISV